MALRCPFSRCRWYGDDHEVFEHCEDFHANCIKGHLNRNYYDFSFDDLTREAFLLTRPDGIYWFLLDKANDANAQAEHVRRGVFQIGGSPAIEYTVKFGLIRDGHAHYFGPFDSHAERPSNTAAYELELSMTFVTAINDAMPSRQFRLYIGEYNDSDDVYVPESDELDKWQGTEAEANATCIELFTCPVCLEFIRKDPCFCERRHYVCSPCFKKMHRRNKLRCPICREQYTPDCQDERINDLLKMVQLPGKHRGGATY